MKTVFKDMLIYFVTFVLAILLIGVFEITKNEFLFSTVEDNLINVENVPIHTVETYYDFRNSYTFSNEIFTDVVNFLGSLGIFYLFYRAWLSGWNSPKFSLSNVLISYNLVFIILFYFMIILFDYFTSIFLDQFIFILFIDIYNALYMFEIFIDYSIGIFILGVLISYLGNLTRFSDIVSNK